LHKLIIISILIVVIPLTGIAQINNDSVPKIVLGTIATVNQGNSFITLPADLGNLEPLWFEANIVPNFLIRKSKNSRLMGVLTPQIIIRMYQEESAPVRTPSYIPQLAVYYSLNETRLKKTYTLFGKFAHHSNGQDGDFYLPDGDINLKTGNFSTNYVEFGIINTHFNKKLNAMQFYSTSLEVHAPGWSIEELEGQYSMVRWHNGVSIYKIPVGKRKSDNSRAGISLKANAMWMFGDISEWEPFSFNRLNVDLTFYYHLPFMEDIGLFAQVFSGMDYYNIYFNHRLMVIRFGLMTEILKF
jgi:outer membrane phospholipase A